MTIPYYSDENVVLYHGDCRELTAWLDADVLVTDPPYGIAHVARKGTYTARGGAASSRTFVQSAVANDSDTGIRDEALTLWGADRPALLFGTWRVPRPAATTNRLIWHKAGSAPGPARAAFLSNDEEIYVLNSALFPATSPPERTVLTTYENRHGAPGEAHRVGHPTPKPVSLMERLLSRCPGGVVADPFAGSGSTLVAARNLSRRAIGVELEERYCEVIARRLSQQVLDFEGAAGPVKEKIQ